MQTEIKSILRPPGAGLLTISSGSELAHKGLAPFFSSKERDNWQLTIAPKLKKKLPFYLIGVPSDSGGGICRGAAHGPLAIRSQLYRKKKALTQNDLGDIPCIPQLVHDSMLNEEQKHKSRVSLWGVSLNELPVSPLNILEDLLVELWRTVPHFKPLVLGGDHSISGAIFSALDRSEKLDDLAVLHFDAHTDLLESRFGVEHCFGTWTSHAIKKHPKPALWAQVGIRASRKEKAHWEKSFGLKQYWSQELRKTMPKVFAAELLKYWKNLGAKKLYITNDIDATDSMSVPSTGTPEAKGLSPAWIDTVIKMVSADLPLVGADLVEVAPVLGSKIDSRKTVQVAVKYLQALNWH